MHDMENKVYMTMVRNQNFNATYQYEVKGVQLKSQ